MLILIQAEIPAGARSAPPTATQAWTEFDHIKTVAPQSSHCDTRRSATGGINSPRDFDWHCWHYCQPICKWHTGKELYLTVELARYCRAVGKCWLLLAGLA